MKIWISYDMEGVAGIVDWDQCRPGSDGYALGCALLLDEVNAAIEGAVAGGATEVLLNDSHSRMSNLDPRAVVHPDKVRFITGRHKPMYMMQGLDDTVDGAFLIGYHGSISGGSRPRCRTPTTPRSSPVPASTARGWGESGINALVTAHHGVPIALVTGDEVTWDETEPFAPDAEHVVTKTSITRASADSLHPTESCRRIHDAAERAARRVGEMASAPITAPATLELDLQTGDMADVATWVGGVDRTATRTVAIRGDDLLSVFTRFVAVNYITRQAGGR
ncbi:M55 family metallopeptidase [Curtobacterium sp. MCPF17_052]|uniref:M55 family metallopeptidase n=1 Tax=Curtobacterium sp. MCPF17_052 TaxID=2175655 RepID=UPI0024E011DB|nr:M55 family metallopeptidase [Curtobacterium sp. MCPF17_052]WIB12692.1 M55 family metallopeptidase [Curtobacterium sp. MCPF17_052]